MVMHAVSPVVRRKVVARVEVSLCSARKFCSRRSSVYNHLVLDPIVAILLLF